MGLRSVGYMMIRFVAKRIYLFSVEFWCHETPISVIQERFAMNASSQTDSHASFDEPYSRRCLYSAPNGSSLSYLAVVVQHEAEVLRTYINPAREST